MKSVKVIIEETCVQEFEIIVDDENEDNAIDIAIQKYQNEQLVAEPGEVQYRQIAIANSENPVWVQF